MTSWSEIITNSVMVFIDDIRMEKQLLISPAMFYGNMAKYLKLALPLLSDPPELLLRLQSEMTEPENSELIWTSTEESTGAETVVKTGRVGYDICSVTVFVSENGGTAINAEYEEKECGIEIPYTEAVYNSETGEVTFPKQDKSGVKYRISLYKDGTFTDLTLSMMRLFGLAAAIVWDERFGRNWLNIQMKIKDPSFNTGNEAEYISAVTERLAVNRRLFEEELKKYEQNTIYLNTSAEDSKIKNFI